jgi:hypothetical protein
MKNLPSGDNLFSRNTLLFDAGTGLAILVTTRRGRMQQRPMRVADAHAANLIYIAIPDLASN